jgi:hypothetical protein
MDEHRTVLDDQVPAEAVAQSAIKDYALLINGGLLKDVYARGPGKRSRITVGFPLRPLRVASIDVVAVISLRIKTKHDVRMSSTFVPGKE